MLQLDFIGRTKVIIGDENPLHRIKMRLPLYIVCMVVPDERNSVFFKKIFNEAYRQENYTQNNKTPYLTLIVNITSIGGRYPMTKVHFTETDECRTNI